ncbi:hypothetical protein HanIR_Chr07g0330271 [Helianthus annuus]|nr:hypothetical protein HanIR_Chr07g0330271 [Helianthus annuus]
MTPLNLPDSQALEIIRESASITIKKRKGDNGSPCLNPFWHWNSKVGDPFTRTEDLVEARIPLTHLHHS